MLPRVLVDLHLELITYLPGYTGFRLRWRYYAKKMKYIHPTVKLDLGVQLVNPESISLGQNTHIDRFVILIAGRPRLDDTREIRDVINNDFRHTRGELVIGENCHIAPHCLLSGIGGLSLGNCVTISADSKIYSLTHHYRSFNDPSNQKICFGSNVDKSLQSLIRGPVVLEDNVGVAANCLILPGVTIEAGSFVSIGSVVNRRVLTNQVVGGNPAVYIKDRFKPKEEC